MIPELRERIRTEVVRRLARLGTRDAVEALEALDRLSISEMDLLVQKELAQ